MNYDELEDFLGKKFKRMTMTFSFRLSLIEIQKLLDGDKIEIDMKGKTFNLQRKGKNE